MEKGVITTQIYRIKIGSLFFTYNLYQKKKIVKISYIQCLKKLYNCFKQLLRD